MKKTSIHALAESVLKQMECDGFAKITITMYWYNSLKKIVNYFERVGEIDYSDTLIDEYIMSTRAEYESGKISQSIWKKIRRGGELLKSYYRNETLELPRCRYWEILHDPLRRNPTEDEMTDPDNIWGLVARTKQEMSKLGYSESTIEYHAGSFRRIIQAHNSLGTSQYTPEILHEMMLALQKDMISGTLKPTAFRTFRKTITMIDEKHKLGTLSFKPMSPIGVRELTETFAKLLNGFEAGITNHRSLKPRSIRQYKSHTHCFLLELEDDGIFSFDEMTPALFSEQITKTSKKYKGGLRTILNALRAFFEYLHINGDTTTDLSLAIPKFFSPHRKIYEGFSCEEIDSILSAPDTSTKTGKRNYAILMLAFHTGIRACDISILKMQDICWYTNEIKIVQSKTEVPLTIPLSIEIGNAIADYILYARPKSDEPYIFLSSLIPHRRLDSRTVSSRVTLCMNSAGVENSPTKRLGLHSFRRSLGKRMLESEVSFELIREILGHTKLDSLNPYIAIDESNLQNCALGLVSLEKAGDSQ
jgi:site-specific recombinase XerD